MKKIMFNDRYGLTEAVLSGRKTQTRRIVSERLWDKWTDYDDFCNSVAVGDIPTTREYYDEKKFFIDNSPYKVGEVVAVAQRYKDIVERIAKKGYDTAKWMDEHHITKNLAGWLNKMFVKASLMIFKARITNVRAERLQEISDDDCEKEGIYCDVDPMEPSALIWTFPNAPQWYWTPREAYAALIDRIAGKGTWESNPYVFVYDFELLE